MSDLIGQSNSWLASMQKQYASETVTIRRGAASASVSASRGSSNFQLEQSDGAIIREQATNFIIDKSDYVFDGLACVPERNDTITDANGVVYLVVPFGSYPEWEWAEGHRYRYLIHTRENGDIATLKPR